MKMNNTTRAAAAAAATAIVGTTSLAGAPAHGTPARAGASVVDGVLVVSGTNADDRITVDFTSPGSVVVDLGDGPQSFAAAGIRSASIDLRSGDDYFRTRSGGLQVDVPMTIRGGNGEDLLLGGAGSDLLVGGNGADFVNGGVGTDVEVLGSGDDTAAWNPGEGNDTIDGGLGRDTLVFNGSNGDEVMSLSADGRSAVFLRNLGNIRMDLDSVERLDLATFGGADTVTIDDLSGTEVTTAEVDLAATTGGGDAKDDIVRVNGTADADQVDVAAGGGAVGAVDVAGLTARTIVTGGEPTDELHVSTLGGDDRVTVSDAARALLDVQADLGADE